MIFTNEEFGNVRIIEIDGKAWFVGKDIAAALGYGKERNAIQKHVDTDDALKWGIMDSLGREQRTTVINESGVYALIFGSKLESAKRFKHWVTSEVLPSIHRTGSYSIPKTTSEQIQLIAKGYTELEEKINNQQKEINDIKDRLDVIGAFDNEWMLKKIQDVTKAKVLHMTEEPIHKVLWARYFFAGIYKELKDTFKVSSLKSIPSKHMDDAISIINHWFPTTLFLQNRIYKMQAMQETNQLSDKKIIALLQYLKETKDGAINPFSK